MTGDATPTNRTVELLEKSVLSDGFFPLVLCKLRHTLFAGGLSRAFTREILQRDPVSAVLPYDPVRDTVVLLEQFRAGKMLSGAADPWMIEIVAGIMGSDETPEEVARREAVEEAGCSIETLEPVADFYPSAGGSSEFVHIFCGKVDSQGLGGIHGLAQEDEDIRVMVTSADEAMQLVANRKMDNAIAIMALQWLALNRDRLRRLWT
ncbi:MAG: NUDIX domain-containing protein [Pseudomonadota bacterium]